LGIAFSLPWTWYLVVLPFIWVAAFLVVDRRRQKRQNESGEPARASDKRSSTRDASPGTPAVPALLGSARESLAQVEHQIRLLRNVLWWYLLPFLIPILVFFAHVAWRTSQDWLERAAFFGFLSSFVVALYGWIYWLNQRAVRLQLEPRRQELLALVASLGDESTGDVSGEYPILMSAKGVEGIGCSRRRMFVAGVCAVAILIFGVPGIFFIASKFDHPERSPFAAVRWMQSQPEVQVGDTWFVLVSLDEIPAAEIVAFSQRTYGEKWQKRFEEDLVALLTEMGHPPQDTVTLVVKSLTTSKLRTIKNVPMTRANRRAIRNAAQARERGEE
jgi:hypothetical protein